MGKGRLIVIIFNDIYLTLHTHNIKAILIHTNTYPNQYVSTACTHTDRGQAWVYVFRKMSSRSVLLPQGNTARPVMRAIKIPADRTMEWAQDYRMGTGVP